MLYSQKLITPLTCWNLLNFVTAVDCANLIRVILVLQIIFRECDAFTCIETV